MQLLYFIFSSFSTFAGTVFLMVLIFGFIKKIQKTRLQSKVIIACGYRSEVKKGKKPKEPSKNSKPETKEV